MDLELSVDWQSMNML
uniref:Uncharacterized protein n=1 Tax=Arundo donax TaxID=35708 RepID=A0A0A9GSW5_ARUDO